LLPGAAAAARAAAVAVAAAAAAAVAAATELSAKNAVCGGPLVPVCFVTGRCRELLFSQQQQQQQQQEQCVETCCSCNVAELTSGIFRNYSRVREDTL